MTNFEIKLNVDRFIQSYDSIWNTHIDTMRKEIENLPDDEQKFYWERYDDLVDHINLSFDIIGFLAKELYNRPNSKQFKSEKEYNLALREYVKILGGDPNVCSYVKKSDYENI
jgi:hypothetical protein